MRIKDLLVVLVLLNPLIVLVRADSMTLSPEALLAGMEVLYHIICMITSAFVFAIFRICHIVVAISFFGDYFLPFISPRWVCAIGYVISNLSLTISYLEIVVSDMLLTIYNMEIMECKLL